MGAKRKTVREILKKPSGRDPALIDALKHNVAARAIDPDGTIEEARLVLRTRESARIPMDAQEFKELREDLNLDPHQLAVKLGIRRPTVTRYENGSLTISTRTERAIENIAELERLRM